MHEYRSRLARTPLNARVALWLMATCLLLGAAGNVLRAEDKAGAGNAQTPAAARGEKRITPAEAKKLFALVDELMKFSSDDTGLAIKAPVKRQLTTRAAVETYMKAKLEEDKSAQRMQRDEIVLKKFGLLDRDFDLGPFLLSLLTEQVEAYYDEKTKTVNLLDWVDVEEQKPVMAHELTHALQDQKVGLEKWGDQTPEDVSTDAASDADHLAKDEIDTARDAVTEGQATAVMMDYILKPMGKSLVKDPEIMNFVRQQMTGNTDSPVMARAPLLLSESMLFPYREGLSFEQDVWMDQGQTAAFAGMLDHPPTSSWEIMNPREYEQKHVPAVPLLPNIHPLVDKLYTPYDIGQVGELDLNILTKLLGGDGAANDLTPAWNGGIYWAGQQRSAKTPAEQNTTGALALIYLSAWRNEASAQRFAQIYGENLARKYENVKPEAATAPEDQRQETVRLFETSEGPVLITTRGKLVFVAESFPLELARKLTALVLDAQGTGELKMAQTARPGGVEAREAGSRQTLTADLVRLFGESGVLKAAVDAEVRAANLRRY